MDFSAVPSPESEATRPVASLPNPVFYHEGGLRAGWRLLLYFSIAAFLYLLEIIPVSSLFRTVPSQFLVSTIILGETITFVAAYGPAFVMSRIELREIGAYG